MATIKSYTDINQSKRLADILLLETADMHYCLEKRDVATGYEIGITPFIQARRFKGKCNIVDIQPAWSLVALLDILKDKIIFGGASDKDWFVAYTAKTPRKLLTIYKSNLVDACVAMVEKLNELNLL